MQPYEFVGSNLQEQAAYFRVPRARLHTVLHQAEEPRARLLLVGSFASDRHYSYRPWVQWARYLAQRGIEVLRFDYRGIGESEGAFEDLSFADWMEDIQLLGSRLRDLTPKIPLVLHGLEMGALLAGKAFHQGLGDLLLLWSPPANANLVLRSMLLRGIVLDQLFKFGDDRKPAAAYIRELEEGASIEVEGYQWSAKLWKDSFEFVMPPALEDESQALAQYQRPVRVLRLPKDAVPLVRGGYWVADDCKDFTSLFADNLEWVTSNLGAARGSKW